VRGTAKFALTWDGEERSSQVMSATHLPGAGSLQLDAKLSNRTVTELEVAAKEVAREVEQLYARMERGLGEMNGGSNGSVHMTSSAHGSDAHGEVHRLTSSKVGRQSVESLDVEATMLLSHLEKINSKISRLKRAQGAAQLQRLGRCQLNMPLIQVGSELAAQSDDLKRQFQIEVAHVITRLPMISVPRSTPLPSTIFRPWEQHYENSTDALRLYITITDFNWRDSELSPAPYNGSKGYVPVQAELVGRQPPIRCASKHTALLGVCAPDGTLEPTWYHSAELQVPTEILANQPLAGGAAHIMIYCNCMSADGIAMTSTFAILPLSLSNMHDGLVRNGSYELPLYQHTDGRSGGEPGSMATGVKCGLVKFNLQLASGEPFAATSHALRDFGSPRFSDEQILQGLSAAAGGSDVDDGGGDGDGDGDLTRRGSVSGRGSGGAVADIVFDGLKDPLDIMRLQIPLLNRMHSILSHDWAETTRVAEAPVGGDTAGLHGNAGGANFKSIITQSPRPHAPPSWKPPSPHQVEVQQIQILHRMIHLMLSDELYDPHALDQLATRLCVFFRLDFLCHAAVDLAGSYVDRVSQPSFNWDNGLALKLQSAKLGNAMTNRRLSELNTSVADALDDLAVRCYLLGASASQACKIKKGPEVRLAGGSGGGGSGGHNGGMSGVDNGLHEFYEPHHRLDEHGDLPGAGLTDSVKQTIQTLTEEVHDTISNIVDAMSDVIDAMDYLQQYMNDGWAAGAGTQFGRSISTGSDGVDQHTHSASQRSHGQDGRLSGVLEDEPYGSSPRSSLNRPSSPADSEAANVHQYKLADSVYSAYERQLQRTLLRLSRCATMLYPGALSLVPAQDSLQLMNLQLSLVDRFGGDDVDGGSGSGGGLMEEYLLLVIHMVEGMVDTESDIAWDSDGDGDGDGDGDWWARRNNMMGEFVVLAVTISQSHPAQARSPTYHALLAKLVAIITKPQPPSSAEHAPDAQPPADERFDQGMQVRDMLLLGGGLVEVLQELLTRRGLASTDRKALAVTAARLGSWLWSCVDESTPVDSLASMERMAMALSCKALAWTTLSDTLQLHYGIRTRTPPPLYGAEADNGSLGDGVVSAESWLRSHFKALMLADASVVKVVSDHLIAHDHAAGSGDGAYDRVVDELWRSVVVVSTVMLTLSVVCVDERATHKAASEVGQSMSDTLSRLVAWALVPERHLFERAGNRGGGDASAGGGTIRVTVRAMLAGLDTLAGYRLKTIDPSAQRFAQWAHSIVQHCLVHLCAHEATIQHNCLPAGPCAHALFEFLEPLIVLTHTVDHKQLSKEASQGPAESAVGRAPRASVMVERGLAERAVQFVEELELVIKEQRDSANMQVAALGEDAHEELELSKRTSHSFTHLLVSMKRLRELVNMYCTADRSSYIGGLVSLAVLQQMLTGFRTFSRPEQMAELIELMQQTLYRLSVSAGAGGLAESHRDATDTNTSGFHLHRSECARMTMWQATIQVWKIYLLRVGSGTTVVDLSTLLSWTIAAGRQLKVAAMWEEGRRLCQVTLDVYSRVRASAADYTADVREVRSLYRSFCDNLIIFGQYQPPPLYYVLHVRNHPTLGASNWLLMRFDATLETTSELGPSSSQSYLSDVVDATPAGAFVHFVKKVAAIFPGARVLLPSDNWPSFTTDCSVHILPAYNASPGLSDVGKTDRDGSLNGRMKRVSNDDFVTDSTPHSMFTVVSLAALPGEEPLHPVQRGVTGMLGFNIPSHEEDRGLGLGWDASNGEDVRPEQVVEQRDLHIPDVWVSPALLLTDVEVTEWGLLESADAMLKTQRSMVDQASVHLRDGLRQTRLYNTMAVSPMSDVDMSAGISILRNALIAVLEQILSPDLAACIGYQNVATVLEDLNDVSEMARKERRQELKRAYQKEAKSAALAGLADPPVPDYNTLTEGDVDPMLEVVRRDIEETKMSVAAAIDLLRTVARDDKERQQSLCMEALFYAI